MTEVKSLCYCHLYTFPHRKGGGKCKGPAPFICSACGNACSAVEDTEVLEGSDAWGGMDSAAVTSEVSECCGAMLWPNDAGHGKHITKEQSNAIKP